MKMTKNTWMIALLLLAPQAFARTGAEGGGGGQFTDVNETKELTDIASQAVCTWETGEEFIAQHPDFKTRIITPLQNLDWYFADDIYEEAESLRYCLTGALRKVRPADPGSPVRPPQQWDSYQAGFRLNNTICLDWDLFNDPSVSESNRSFLILHEVMHSYLPMNVFQRQLKLRSMVNAISQVVSGQVKTRAQLHYDMTQNDIQFPQTVDKLDPYRTELEFLLGTSDEQAQQITNLTEIDTILDLPLSQILSNLASYDQTLLTNQSPRMALENALLQRLTTDDLADFKTLLLDPRFKRLHPIMLALGNLDNLSADQTAFVFSQDARGEIFQALYGPISSAKLTKLDDGRAALDAESDFALGATPGQVALLDLRSPTALPLDFEALAELLTHLAIAGDWDSITAIAGAGTPFLSTIQLTPLQQAVTQFQFSFPVEAKTAGERVTLIAKQIQTLFTQELQSSLSADQYSKLNAILFNQEK
jgi:hypothetical protein